MYRVAFLLFLMPTWLNHADAQTFKRYTTSDGLSDNVVTGIAEDSTGFLWMTTRSGLNRFNGNSFVQYHSTNNSWSLPAEELGGIYRLDNHRLAVTGTGIHIIDTRTGKQKNIFIPYKDNRYTFKLNMTMQARGDKNGDLFVVSRSGFYHFSGNDSLVYRFDYYPDSLIPVRHLVFGGKILELDEQRLLITSVNGLHVYEKTKRRFYKLKKDEILQLNQFYEYPTIAFEYLQIKPGVFFIFHPGEKKLYYINLKQKLTQYAHWPSGMNEPAWRSKLIATDKNSFVLTLQQSGFARIHFDSTDKLSFYVSSKNELPEYICNDVVLDRERRLLVATNKGLLRQQLRPQAVQTGFAASTLSFADASFDDVVSLGDKVYAGTRGAGLAVFAKTDLKFEMLLKLPGTHPGINSITALLAMPGRKLLVGTSANPAIFDQRSEKFSLLHPPGWTSNYWVHNINADKHGNALISGYLTYRYNPSDNSYESLPVHQQLLDVPVSIQEDSAGYIWVARHGLARYNVWSKQYDRYVDSFPFIKMPDKQVTAFTIDRNNTIWLGLYNNGLVSYSPGSGEFKHFTKKNGLPNEQVSAVHYLDNKIWVASHAGISMIDIESFVITNYGPEDGFPASPVNPGSRFFYDSADKQLYIAFADMVARFDPVTITSEANPPRVFIENVTVNGKTSIYLPESSIVTTWKNRQLRISIGNINYFDGRKQRFAYRFANTEDRFWTDLGEESSFSIEGLSPGLHRLEVRVSSTGNRWSPQIAYLNIIIEAPFWLQPWFLLLAALAMISAIVLLVRWRSSVARRKEMINTQIQQLRAEDYKAQFELEQITHYFSSSLTGKRTEDEIVKDVAERLISSLNYEDCIIYLWNTDKSCMVQKAAFGPKNDDGLIKISDFQVKPGQGIVGHVIETKKPVLVNDTRKDPRYRIDDRFRLSELAVPILHNGDLLGVIDSEHSQADYFNERDIKIMTTIATLLGNKLRQFESEQSLAAKQLELAGINEQLAEARLAALQAQMNPHFVFNALNSIKRMILESENDKASRYLSKFASMIRMTLEHSKEAFITLNDNVEYLKAYLDMERLRFDDTFTWLIDTDESVDDTEITLPPMMIQPLVENAIWHGLMYTDTEKKLLINFSVIDHRLRCIVEDNGIGIRKSKELSRESRPLHRSVGLENLYKRINIMNEKYHTACTLSITDLGEAGEGHGTRVILEMNIISA